MPNHPLLGEALAYRRRNSKLTLENNVACVKLEKSGFGGVIITRDSAGQGKLASSFHSERKALAYAIKKAIDTGLITKPSNEALSTNDGGISLLQWVANDQKKSKMEHGLTRNMFLPYVQELSQIKITVFTDREPCQRPSDNCENFLASLKITDISFLVEYSKDILPSNEQERNKFLDTEKRKMLKELTSQIKASSEVFSPAKNFFEGAKIKSPRPSVPSPQAVTSPPPSTVPIPQFAGSSNPSHSPVQPAVAQTGPPSSSPPMPAAPSLAPGPPITRAFDNTRKRKASPVSISSDDKPILISSSESDDEKDKNSPRR